MSVEGGLVHEALGDEIPAFNLWARIYIEMDAAWLRPAKCNVFGEAFGNRLPALRGDIYVAIQRDTRHGG